MGHLISVIVPIYNTEKYLEMCIESIRNQTYKNLEIILVDDGSTDKSGQICDQYVQKDRRIKVIHKPNGGQSDARNVGIKNATGNFIGFVDSDDYINQNMFKRLYGNLMKYNADIAICNYEDVDENGNHMRYSKKIKKLEVRVLDKRQALYLLIEGKNIITTPWDKLYKIELFSDVEFPKERVMEDLATIYKLFNKAIKIVDDYRIGYYYVQRSRSTFHRVTVSLITNWIEAMHERYNDLITCVELKDILILDRLYWTLNIYKLFYALQEKNQKLEKMLNEEYKFYKKHYKVYGKRLNRNTRLKVEARILYWNSKMFKYYCFLLNIIKSIFKT